MTGHPSEHVHAHDRLEAEIDRIVGALRSYGVLSRSALGDVCHAEHWEGPSFEYVLRVAESQQRVKRLGDDLFELGEAELGPGRAQPGGGT